METDFLREAELQQQKKQETTKTKMKFSQEIHVDPFATATIVLHAPCMVWFL